MSVCGTLKKVTLDGVTFDVFADTDVKEVGSGWENTVIPTSGGNVRKMVSRAESREGITLVCSGAEFDTLKDLAERLDDFPMSYETAAGDVYRATGWIEFESRQTAENKASIQMHPRNSWESFLAL